MKPQGATQIFLEVGVNLSKNSGSSHFVSYVSIIQIGAKEPQKIRREYLEVKRKNSLSSPQTFQPLRTVFCYIMAQS